MNSASRTSWQTRSPPSRTEALHYAADFTDAEAAQLRRGFVPKNMDDRWFIFFESDWLYFHQSRSGACIYGVRLDRAADGITIGNSWVNRNPEEYRQRELELDRRVVDGLIRHLLLRQRDS